MTEDPEASNKEDENAEAYDFSSPFLFSDVVLLVEDERFHCHRAILSLYSPVFKAMFQSPFEETSSNQVSLPEDDASTVRELLKHLYTPGGCEMDSASAQRLLPLIHRLQIDSLITTAERTMTFSMTDTMAPKMLALADLYHLNHLKQVAIDTCVRLDMKRLLHALEETQLSADLKATVFGNRVHLLEKAISDIDRSLTQSCIRMESKLERVFTNHCQVHTKPLSHTTVPLNLQILPTASTSPLDGNTSTAQAPATNEAPLIRPVIRDDDGRPLMAPVAQLPPSQQPHRLTTRVLQSSSVTAGEAETEGAAETEANSSTVTALVEVPAICENCVDKISLHIKDLCRKALNKASFVPYRPQQ